MIEPLGDWLSQFPRLQDLITLFLGLITEAFPFVVLGVTVSVIISLFFKEKWLLKFMPKNRFLSHPILSTLGFLMPVCECGNVPVVRRLLEKGFSVSHAVTFLLAAPILNPITLWSTAEAFSFNPNVVLIRMGAGFLIANIVGIILSYHKNQKSLLTDQFNHFCEDHGHEKNKISDVVNIFQREFVTVFKMLIIGALIASASQAFIPRDIITAIGGNVMFSILAMMLLAFVISICANVDAFFALAYANSFTTGSLLSFMVFGPMVDIKMLAMLRTTFKGKTLATIVTIVALLSILVGLIVNYYES